MRTVSISDLLATADELGIPTFVLSQYTKGQVRAAGPNRWVASVGTGSYKQTIGLTVTASGARICARDLLEQRTDYLLQDLAQMDPTWLNVSTFPPLIEIQGASPAELASVEPSYPSARECVEHLTKALGWGEQAALRYAERVFLPPPMHSLAELRKLVYR